MGFNLGFKGLNNNLSRI